MWNLKAELKTTIIDSSKGLDSDFIYILFCNMLTFVLIKNYQLMSLNSTAINIFCLICVKINNSQYQNQQNFKSFRLHGSPWLH